MDLTKVPFEELMKMAKAGLKATSGNIIPASCVGEGFNLQRDSYDTKDSKATDILENKGQ